MRGREVEPRTGLRQNQPCTAGPEHAGLGMEGSPVKLMTVKETAERLHCSPSTVYQLCGFGKLPHSRIGLGRGVIRIAEGDIDELLR